MNLWNWQRNVAAFLEPLVLFLALALAWKFKVIQSQLVIVSCSSSTKSEAQSYYTQLLMLRKWLSDRSLYSSWSIPMTPPFPPPLCALRMGFLSILFHATRDCWYSKAKTCLRIFFSSQNRQGCDSKVAFYNLKPIYVPSFRSFSADCKYSLCHLDRCSSISSVKLHQASSQDLHNKIESWSYRNWMLDFWQET